MSTDALFCGMSYNSLVFITIPTTVINQLQYATRKVDKEEERGGVCLGIATMNTWAIALNEGVKMMQFYGGAGVGE